MAIITMERRGSIYCLGCSKAVLGGRGTKFVSLPLRLLEPHLLDWMAALSGLWLLSGFWLDNCWEFQDRS